ncbi:MAG: VanW family protein [Candidatus Berkelbacteria bacterium]|nr:VanW family protein [Candidatus Berkelbacteria bacterium]
MEKTKPRKKHLAKIIFLVTSASIVLLLLAFVCYSFVYSKKVFPHISLANAHVSGKSRADLNNYIEGTAKSYQVQLITLHSVDNDKTYTIDPIEIGLNYDNVATSDQIWNIGRNRSKKTAILEQFLALFRKKNYKYIFTYDQAGVQKKVAAVAEELDQPEKDYAISYKDNKFVLLSERKAGSRINQDHILSDISASLCNLNSSVINFQLQNFEPEVTAENAAATLADANKIISSGGLNLTAGDQKTALDVDTVASFITSKPDGQNLTLTFDDTAMTKYISALASKVDHASVNSKLTIQSGKVTVFQPSSLGATLDQKQAVADIKTTLLDRLGQTEVLASLTLKVDTQKPEISDSDISTLGINDLVGTATTDFKNSPTNRVFNITTGAAAINGVLLAPGEEFSTLAHLGKIDASSSYLPELVIKGNKTVPDYGGGLCQVSSTLFRAALNAGMKITERQNHSYRVSYYEPPIGMDATIYDPAPDFKFLNNYGSHILIQSKIVGTKITFEFYGTKDGRKVVMTDPVTSNITDPAPPVIAETDTLAPGEKKQIQKAHQGATADFHYTVTSASGTVLQDKNFHSVYNAIAEQWLVGKAAATSCSDGAQNGGETGVDCGGSCATACPS